MAADREGPCVMGVEREVSGVSDAVLRELNAAGLTETARWLSREAAAAAVIEGPPATRQMSGCLVPSASVTLHTHSEAARIARLAVGDQGC